MSNPTHKRTTPEIREAMIADAKKMNGFITHISDTLADKYGFSWATVLKTIKPYVKPDKFKRPLTDEVKNRIIQLDNDYKGEANQKIKSISKISTRSYNEVKKVLREHQQKPQAEKMFNHKQFWY